ncbi:phosphatidate cytidylyltransferase [Methyloceanibacter superfactus]|uniref:phosphatidate cytidylyltransferase n=1 Tax=Methyloceanibacter superfactus TaxID=1774969 RepID=UPI003CC7A626
MVWLRSDPNLGLTAVLFLLAVAWTTDTASYVGGRLLGGPKLAPRISPKKTWSGFLVGTMRRGWSAMVSRPIWATPPRSSWLL